MHCEETLSEVMPIKNCIFLGKNLYKNMSLRCMLTCVSVEKEQWKYHVHLEGKATIKKMERKINFLLDLDLYHQVKQQTTNTCWIISTKVSFQILAFNTETFSSLTHLFVLLFSITLVLFANEESIVGNDILHNTLD